MRPNKYTEFNINNEFKRNTTNMTRNEHSGDFRCMLNTTPYLKK